jgi:hypothetical protein
MKTIFWWIFHIFVFLVSTGFLILGINMLRGAYGMQSPPNFFIAFFGSSMMILICGTLIVGFAIRMIHRWRSLLHSGMNQG